MSATITITLPTDLEQIISTKAAADGMGLEEYALSVLRRDAELPSLRDLFADVRAEIEASGVTDEELEQEIDAAVKEVRARRHYDYATN